MNGWGWALWGYGVVFVTLAIYTWTLVMRTRVVQRRLDELE